MTVVLKLTITNGEKASERCLHAQFYLTYNKQPLVQ